MPEEPLPPQLEPEEAQETPQDELGDLRASMAEEEARLKEKKKSGVLKKITGMLHLQTGHLAGSQPVEAPSAPAADDEITDVILAVQVGKTFAGWDEADWEGESKDNADLGLESDAESGETPEPIRPDPLETKPLIWDENDETYLAARQAGVADEDIGVSEDAAQASQSVFLSPPADPAGIELESNPSENMPEAEVAPLENTPETAQTESLRAELMPEVSPASPPPPEKPKPGLWKRVTGWLNPNSVAEDEVEPPAEVADELISDRLQRAQSTDYAPSIPGRNKFADLYSPPTFVTDEREEVSGSADSQEESSQSEEDVWTGSRTATFRNQPGWKHESRLPDEWVAPHAAFAREEPVATDYLAGSGAEAGEAQPAAKVPSLLSSMAAQGAEEPAPAIEDVRSVALEGYVEPAVDTVAALEPEVREPTWQRARTWARKRFALLVALAAALVVLIALAAIQPWNLAPSAQPNTPVPSDQPYPVGLELTGGWFFDINRSTIVNGVWQPQSAEWLDNSQLRRVVALPWNKQSDAVIQTLQRGDQVNLVFSNNDLMPFLVKSVERLDPTDTGLFSENKPGLVIFLYGEDADQRWVVLALPK